MRHLSALCVSAYAACVNLVLRWSQVFGLFSSSLSQIDSNLVSMKRAEKKGKLLKVSKKSKVKKSMQKQFKNKQKSQILKIFCAFITLSSDVGRINLGLSWSQIFGLFLSIIGQIVSNFVSIKRSQKEGKLLEVSKESKVKKSMQKQFIYK